MPNTPQDRPETLHDVFISYSRRNESFAEPLRKALASYKPPPGIAEPRRPLKVFLDKQDFTGTEYHASLTRHLNASSKLLVLCSPDAFRSTYVNDEIQNFVRLKSANDIIPVLVAGIPNNEVKTGEEDLRAFPPALCESHQMPLAADFRGFVTGRDSPNRGRYASAWYSVLANIYDVPRSEIEQRDRKQQARRRWITATVSTVIFALIAAALLLAWRSNQDAQAKARSELVRRYIGSIGLAQEAYNSTNLPGMVDILKSTPVDLRGFEWRYLWRLSQGAGAVIPSGSPNVWSVAISPDGKWFATGSDDGKVRLWSMDTRQMIQEMAGQAGAAEVMSLAFSPAGNGKQMTLAAAGRKMPVRLWDVGTRALIREVKELGECESIAFSPDGGTLAGISNGPNVTKVVRLWDVKSRAVKDTLTAAGTASASGMIVAFSPDAALLAISDSYAVTLFRLPSRDPTATFETDNPYITDAVFSPDGKVLATGDDGGKLVFFDVKTHKKLATIDAHDGVVNNVAFTRDGRFLITAGDDKLLRVWDAATYAAVGTLKGHADQIHSLAISPDGMTALSGSEDGTARLWTVSGRPEYEELKSSDIVVSSIAVSMRDDVIAIARLDALTLWDAAAHKELATIDKLGGPFTGAAFSPDGAALAILVSSNDITLRDSTTGKTDKLTGHTGEVYAIAFSPDGRMLASAGADHTMRVWDVGARKQLAIGSGHTKSIMAVAFSPDGNTVATGANDRTLKLWDAATGRQIASAQAIADSVRLDGDVPGDQQPLITSVAFSPDGRTLATSGVDHAIKIWSTTKGTLQQIATLQGHTNAVNAVAFSPDGKTIASGGADAKVRLWNVPTYSEMISFQEQKGNNESMPHALRGQDNQVRSVAFSRDGAFLATGLVDGTVRIRRGSGVDPLASGANNK